MFLKQQHQLVSLLCLYSAIFIAWMFYSTANVYPTLNHENAEVQTTRDAANIHLLTLEVAERNPINITYKPERKKEYLKWKQVLSKSKYDFLHVLSAFYDDLNKNKPAMVRVIAYGMIETMEHAIKCSFDIPGKKNKYWKKAKLVRKDNHKIIYVICIIMSAQIPKVLHINTGNTNVTTLQVINAGKQSCSQKEKTSINVYVKTLYNNFNSTKQLLEFMEYYRMQGVSHFTFNNVSCAPQVSKLLHYYEDLGIVTIVSQGAPAHIPSPLKIQDVMVNDCIYRSRGVFSHVINIDMDEFMLPKNHKDIFTMVKQLNTQGISGYKAGRYEFFKHLRMSRSAKEHNKRISNKTEMAFKLDTQLYTTRLLKPCKTRGKSIARPCYTDEMRVHTIVSSVKGFHKVFLPEKLVNVHHYRSYRKTDRVFRVKCPRIRRTRDDFSMLRFKKVLLQRMLETLSESEVDLTKL